MEHRSNVGGSKIVGILVVVFLVLLSLLVLYPLVYVVTAAFTPGRGIATLPIIPFTNGATLSHFTQLFQQTNYRVFSIRNLTRLEILPITAKADPASIFYLALPCLAP